MNFLRNFFGEKESPIKGKIRVEDVKITDQARLAEVAKTAGTYDVRDAAIEKLTDQVVLAEIAKTASDSSVREAAVTRLSNVQKAEVEKSIDQIVLAGIAKTASEYSVRKAAVGKLTDQAIDLRTEGGEHLHQQVTNALLIIHDEHRRFAGFTAHILRS